MEYESVGVFLLFFNILLLAITCQSFVMLCSPHVVKRTGFNYYFLVFDFINIFHFLSSFFCAFAHYLLRFFPSCVLM